MGCKCSKGFPAAFAISPTVPGAKIGTPRQESNVLGVKLFTTSQFGGTTATGGKPASLETTAGDRRRRSCDQLTTGGGSQRCSPPSVDPIGISKARSTPGLVLSSIEGVTQGDIRDVYRLGPVLGSGSFGQVRSCMHRQTEKQFACKIMAKNPSRLRKSASTINYVQMFKNEIEILRELDHPNAVKLVEVFEDRHLLYAVMDRCEGGELFARIVQKRRFGEHEARRHCRDMLGALAYIHSRNIVHRDVKAENFLFRRPPNHPDSHLVLIDFGMSVKLTEQTKTLRQVCGSPHYVAPELIRKCYRQEVDLWALGVVMFLMLYGRYPFEGHDQKQIAQKILKGEPDYARGGSYPPSSIAVGFLKGLLQKDPLKRLTPQTAMKHPWLYPPHPNDLAPVSTAPLSPHQGGSTDPTPGHSDCLPAPAPAARHTSWPPELSSLMSDSQLLAPTEPRSRMPEGSESVIIGTGVQRSAAIPASAMTRVGGRSFENEMPMVYETPRRHGALSAAVTARRQTSPRRLPFGRTVGGGVVAHSQKACLVLPPSTCAIGDGELDQTDPTVAKPPDLIIAPAAVADDASLGEIREDRWIGDRRAAQCDKAFAVSANHQQDKEAGHQLYHPSRRASRPVVESRLDAQFAFDSIASETISYVSSAILSPKLLSPSIATPTSLMRQIEEAEDEDDSDDADHRHSRHRLLADHHGHDLNPARGIIPDPSEDDALLIPDHDPQADCSGSSSSDWNIREDDFNSSSRFKIVVSQHRGANLAAARGESAKTSRSATASPQVITTSPASIDSHRFPIPPRDFNPQGRRHLSPDPVSRYQPHGFAALWKRGDLSHHYESGKPARSRANTSWSTRRDQTVPGSGTLPAPAAAGAQSSRKAIGSDGRGRFVLIATAAS